MNTTVHLLKESYGYKCLCLPKLIETDTCEQTVQDIFNLFAIQCTYRKQRIYRRIRILKKKVIVKFNIEVYIN